MDDQRRRFGFIIFVVCIACGTNGQTPEINYDTNLGARAELPCNFNNQEPSSTVRWYRGSELLTDGINVYRDKNKFEVEKPTRLEWNLIIKVVRREDERLYICKDGFNEKARVQLHVMSKPEINTLSSSPNENYVNEFDNITLTCDATGKPTPTLTWYRESLEEGSIPKELGVTGRTLTIFNTTRYATDIYICKAINSYGSASRSMKVVVNFKPEVMIYQTEIIADTDEDVLMTCVIQGEPLTDVYWKTNNGRRIDKTSWKYEYENDHKAGYPVHFLTVRIKPGSWNVYDYGIYTCIAENQQFSESATVELKKPTHEKIIHY